MKILLMSVFALHHVVLIRCHDIDEELLLVYLEGLLKAPREVIGHTLKQALWYAKLCGNLITPLKNGDAMRIRIG